MIPSEAVNIRALGAYVADGAAYKYAYIPLSAPFIPLGLTEEDLEEYLQGYREAAEAKLLAQINHLSPAAARYFRTHLSCSEPFEIHHLERRSLEEA
jgi:hypothetical protein